LAGRDQLDLFGGAPPAVRPAAAPAAVHATAAALPDRIRLGTSSWSFPGWAGLVYDREHPPGMLAREGIAAYAAHPLLRTVSIDRGHYGPVPPAELRALAVATPDAFRFVLKADRVLTRPRDPAGRPSPRFLDGRLAWTTVVEPAVAALGPGIGLVLFQFSPMQAATVGGPRGLATRVARFLEDLGAAVPVGFELRTPGLLHPRWADMLRAHGAVHVYASHPSLPPLDVQFARIPPVGPGPLVVRWLLHASLGYAEARDHFAPFDRLVDEDPGTRETIARAAVLAAREDRDVYVLVNNKAEGSAPLSVVALADRITRIAR
jgi:uncharacterized protein YecE (DUF72 family)